MGRARSILQDVVREAVDAKKRARAVLEARRYDVLHNLSQATYSELDALTDLAGMHKAESLREAIKQHPRYSLKVQVDYAVERCNDFPDDPYIEHEMKLYEAVFSGLLSPRDLDPNVRATFDRLARAEARLMKEMPTFTAGIEQRIRWGALRGVIARSRAENLIARIQYNTKNRPAGQVTESYD